MNIRFGVVIGVLLGVAGLAGISPGASAQGETGCGPLPDPSELSIVVQLNATRATITIPELGLTGSTGDAACFIFRGVHPPRSPMLISFEITAEGRRPSTWKNYIVLFDQPGNGPMFTPQLEAGTEPYVVDPCPSLIANPQSQSAVQQLHASLCAELAGLPSTGLGPEGRSHGPAALSLAIIGSALIFASRTLRKSLR